MGNEVLQHLRYAQDFKEQLVYVQTMKKQIDSRNRAIIRFLMDRAKSDMAYHANELAYKTQSKCGNNHNFNLVMVNPQ